MKKTLGSLILFLGVSVFASPLVDYNLKVSNHNPFLKESVEIIFEALQVDKNSVMFFELKPHKSQDFELYLIEKLDTKKSYHESKTIYRYILFPLKSGKIQLDFDFKVLRASDAAVEKFYTGNRDVINPMATNDTDIELNPLIFEVKALDRKVDFVGDFELDFELDKKEISAYEQLNLTYKLKGKGRVKAKKEILPKISGVNSFLELSGDVKSFIKGGQLVYRYALLSDKDFEIPEIEIECFSPQKNKYYTLNVPAHNIKVSSMDIKNLLDDKDSYPTTAFDWSAWLAYINGFLLMLTGFIIAKLDPMQYFKKSYKYDNPIYQKIKDVKDEKALLRILLSADNSKYKLFIKQLEESIYANKKCDFSKIKASLLDQ